MTLHELVDFNYSEDGDDVLRRMLAAGADPNIREGALSEAPLHVAARRRRTTAVAILLDHGAEIDATTAGGKTAYAHAVRRGFDDVAELLRVRQASTLLNEADRLAVAIVRGRLDEAQAILRLPQASPGQGTPRKTDCWQTWPATTMHVPWNF